MPSSKHAVHDSTAEGGHHAKADEHDGRHQLEAESKRRVWVSKVKLKPFFKYTAVQVPLGHELGLSQNPHLFTPTFYVQCACARTLSPKQTLGPISPHIRRILDDLISYNK